MPPLSEAAIRRLSTLQPFRALLRIGFEWSVIIACSATVSISKHPALALIAIFIIGSRQHALAILLHDAAHYRLCKNHRLNDFFSNLFIGYPLGISTALYRKRHLLHHQFINSKKDPDLSDMRKDPDWQWPKAPRDAGILFLKDLVGLRVLAMFKITQNWSPATKKRSSEFIYFTMYYAAIFVALAMLGGFKAYFFFWLLPSLTALSFIFRIRSVAEHLGVEDRLDNFGTRTVIASWWERIFIAPCNVGYHLEHHLYPSVPYYNLPEVHNRLKDTVLYQIHAHITRSYLGRKEGVLFEVTHMAPLRAVG